MKKKITAGVIAAALAITALAMTFSIPSETNSQNDTEAFCYIFDDIIASS